MINGFKRNLGLAMIIGLSLMATGVHAQTSGGDASCTVRGYTHYPGWGFVASMRVDNNGSTHTDGWSFELNFGNPVTILQSWEVNLSDTENVTSTTATDVGYNGRIRPGHQVLFAIQGTGDPGMITCD